MKTRKHFLKKSDFLELLTKFQKLGAYKEQTTRFYDLSKADQEKTLTLWERLGLKTSLDFFYELENF